MRRLLPSLCLLLLIGCSATPTPAPLNIPPTETFAAPPTFDPTAEPCGYMWASQNLTDLTLDLQAAITALHPEAQAFAFAFGEDCVHQDGSKIFLAMETDFNVTLPVADLADENALGEWIVKTMQVIANLPAEKIVGPRPGRVTMIFTLGTDQTILKFYIDEYQTFDPGMYGWEIFQVLQAQQ